MDKRYLQNPYCKKIQSYLWIVLIVFSTIGCSAKQNLVFSSPSSLDKPLSGSKALSLNSQSSGCISYLSKGSLTTYTIKSKCNSKHKLDAKTAKELGFCFAVGGSNLFHYNFIVDNKPPLYVLFQKLKLCIVA